MKSKLALLIFVGMVVFSASPGWPAGAAKPSVSAKPVFLLNIEGHMGVDAIAVSPDGKILASSGKDKGVKIFDIATKKELRKIYLPAGEGNLGRVSALAFLDEGKLVCAMNTVTPDIGGIYVVNTDDGKIIRCIMGCPSGIRTNGISLSSNKDLASLSFNKGGFAVYRMTDWKKVFSDFTTTLKYSSAAFNDKNQIIAAAENKLTLYSDKFKVIKQVPFNSYKPTGLVCSDHNTFLIGTMENGNAFLYSFENLSSIALLKSDSDKSSVINQICYSSSQASFCMVGAMYFGSSVAYNLLLINPEDGAISVKYKDPKLGFTSVAEYKDSLYLGNSKGEQFLYLSGGITLLAQSEVFNFSPLDQEHRIKFFNDEKRIGFSNRETKTNYEINLEDFSYGRSRFSGIESINQKKNGKDIKISNADILTRTDRRPLFNGKPISLSPADKSCAYSIRRDEKGFFLGTNERLISFDQNGRNVLSVKIGYGGVRDLVNNSDDTVIAVAFTDGTIRWYRTSDFKELLALFPSADGKKWAAWTPMGFYMCGDDSADMIGWQVNQGADKEGLFFPASVFSEHLNRPDIIREILSKHETDEEVVKRLGINTGGVEAQVRTIVELGRMKDASKSVGRVFSVNAASRTVVIAVPAGGEPIAIRQKLYVLVEGRKIYIEAEFPMMASAKCRLEAGVSAADLAKISRGLPVYK
jgi:WD40 repeat protein